MIETRFLGENRSLLDLEHSDEGRLDIPSEGIHVLWDTFTEAVDCATKSQRLNDVIFAACQYTLLICSAESLTEAQSDCWIDRADDYLPLYWMVWMSWVQEYENKDNNTGDYGETH